MRMNFRRLAAGLAAATALSMAAPAWADDVLDRGVGAEWQSLDPQINGDAAAAWILADAFEGLVNFGPSGEILPGSAETWEVSEDGLTWTFHLREGLKWSNGEPLVAQDYVNAVLRSLDPATGSATGYYFSSVMQMPGASALEAGETTDPNVLGMKAPDDRTVVMQIGSPLPHMLDLVGAYQLSPFNKANFDAHGADIYIDGALTVSNGAYVIKEVVPQSHVLLEANPNYWDAANVKIKSVKYHVTEDVSTEYKRYQAGEIDITYDVPLNMLEELKSSGELHIAPTTEIIYYDFNLTKEPFKNIDLRRALSLAIDRETLENKIVKGGSIPTFSYASGFDPTYKGAEIVEASMTQAEREALAQELYAKAGYGPDNVLSLKITSSGAEDPKRRSQGIALMWKKVLGVEAEVEAVDRKAWFDIFYANTWDVFGDDLVGDYAGAETFLNYMRPDSEPVYNWVSPEYDAAMDAAVAITDNAARNEALAKAERILLDSYKFTPVSIFPSRKLVKPNVGGWADSIAGYNNSQWLTLE